MCLKKTIFNIHTLNNINFITKTQRNQIYIAYLIKINPIEQLACRKQKPPPNYPIQRAPSIANLLFKRTSDFADYEDKKIHDVVVA
jgi:hypothetical protein